MFKSFQVPHTLALMFLMMALALILTWFLPAGEFQTEVNEVGREMVMPGTYATLDNAPRLGPWSLFTVIPRAMADAQGIIFFVLIIGGALSVIRQTGAIDAFLNKIILRFGGAPRLLILIGMLCFGVASATLGIAEEYIPLAAILITLCVAMRMDTVTAIAIMVVGYAIGYGVALINPFTVLIAQDVAGLEPTSGMWYRALLWIPFFGVGFHHIWSYARKVQADPSQSLVADVPSAQPPEMTEQIPMTGRRVGVVLAALGALIALVIGITFYGWYLTELGAVFVLLAIVSGLIGGLDLDEMANAFSRGAAELAGTAIIIGFARAIALLLEDALVLHTLVHLLSTPLEMVPAWLSAVGMLFIQATLNLFIPSGSGQAYVTMPLMAPIGDVVEVSRQVSVLAFQLGDGLGNLIMPTNAILMGILGLAGIPYDRWFRFILPLFIKLLVLGALALVVAVLIGYQ